MLRKSDDLKFVTMKYQNHGFLNQFNQTYYVNYTIELNIFRF